MLTATGSLGRQSWFEHLLTLRIVHGRAESLGRNPSQATRTRAGKRAHLHGISEARASDLLLALKHKGEVDGESPLALVAVEPLLDGEDHREDGALVVGGASAVKVAVLADHLEGVRQPLLQGPGAGP